jgi:acyl-CoA reductase-like NAD-dependent aldehyde dehydrogenase
MFGLVREGLVEALRNKGFRVTEPSGHTTPFGGFRTSGFGGRDNGLEALEQYTALKTIWVTLR